MRTKLDSNKTRVGQSEYLRYAVSEKKRGDRTGIKLDSNEIMKNMLEILTANRTMELELSKSKPIFPSIFSVISE